MNESETIFTPTEDDAILLAFARDCGTLEEWKGDRGAWLTALGAFTLGWKAHARNLQENNS